MRSTYNPIYLARCRGLGSEANVDAVGALKV